MTELLGVIGLLEKAKNLSGKYENVVLAEVNDHVVRISLMTGPYFWHVHPDSDEVFLGPEGTMVLHLNGRRYYSCLAASFGLIA